tara:strand:+ start:264 stop:446 length:183 start_codon:yes stop_codon:yes gene_type:complete
MKELVNLCLFGKIDVVLGAELFSKEMAVGITLSFRDRYFFGIMVGPLALVLGIKKSRKLK